jgi:hypothetical protein
MQKSSARPERYAENFYYNSSRSGVFEEAVVDYFGVVCFSASKIVLQTATHSLQM